jgi:pyruvate dehydrogenase (quinone)
VSVFGAMKALFDPGNRMNDFRTDPAVPPIPPHATLDQIEAATTSILKGDSNRAAMIRQGFKAKVQEMLPGRRHRQDRPGTEADS